MAQDTTGVGHWPTTVARHGGKATFSGVARAGKALSGWAGDHRQLGRGGRHPCTRLQATHEGQGGAHYEERPPDRKAKGPQKEMEGEEGQEKCDIPAREREKRRERERHGERERDRDCESARAGVRQGGLQKEQRKQYSPGEEADRAEAGAPAHRLCAREQVPFLDFATFSR